jgi:sialic acid synthase SpsE
MGCYLYAETAFHHEGDEVYLRELIEAVAATGVQGIKFQVLLDVNEFASSRHRAYDSIGRWVFSLDQWRALFQLALDRNLEIIMMPLDTGAFRLAEEFPLRYLDLHSVSFHDPAVVPRLKTAKLPVILGTGGRTPAEINEKISELGATPLTLMTGFQAFPSDLKDIRLSRIACFRQRYPDLLLGYADHTGFADPYAVHSLEYAFLLGARVFEKHVTLQEGKQRVDFEAAVGMDKLKTIKSRLEYLASLLSGSCEDAMEMTPAEIRYRERQKFVVARQALKAGQVLRAEDLFLKITDEGCGYAHLQAVIGRRLVKALERDEVITRESIQ